MPPVTNRPPQSQAHDSHAPQRRTLAARLADRDRGRFAGRRAELDLLGRCMAEDSQVSVVHIVGPGGIGKSALLREIARRARDQGREVISVDGRELGPEPGALEAALRAAATGQRPLVLLDSYEQMVALDGYLRRDLLPALPDQTLVLIAGREAPDPAWFTGGWEAITVRLDVGGLQAAEAQSLLAAAGVADERVPAIIDWASGSPLALTLAAETASADPGWNAAIEPDRPEILRALIHRLAETELRNVRLPALAVAAIARTTTPELLRAVLSGGIQGGRPPMAGPHDDPDDVYKQLCELTVTEPLGDGITLHELLRKALRADLRQRNSELERELRRKIIDYLYLEAIAGQQLLLIDMAHLVENPFTRWGFCWEGSVGYRLDVVRDGDAEEIGRHVDMLQNQPWWELSRRYFEEAQDRVAVVRDLRDKPCGFLVCMSVPTAPGFADADPLTGPWLSHARQHLASGESVLWQAAVDLTRQGQVQGMLGMAGVLRSGVHNPRFVYLPIDAGLPGAVEFARALGAEHLAGLDAVIGSHSVQCHRMDFGPGGLMGFIRDQVYRELGLRPPELANAAAAAQQPPARADLETVRHALRNFLVPHELARNPLARGETSQQRAESVRRQVRAAERLAFGDSENEKLLRRVLIAGYLEPGRSHEEAASRLLLSRAAYFRRLRTAVERLAEYLHVAGSGDDQPPG